MSFDLTGNLSIFVLRATVHRRILFLFVVTIIRWPSVSFDIWPHTDGHRDRLMKFNCRTLSSPTRPTTRGSRISLEVIGIVYSFSF